MSAFLLLINTFVALIKKNFNTEILPKKLKFNDEYLKLKKETVITSGGFSYEAYNILKDVNDTKTNNYSNLFLSKKQKNSNVIEPKNLETSKYPDFVSTISFFAADNNNKNNPGVWMVVDKSYDDYDITVSSFKLIKGGDNIQSNYLFRITCLDDRECVISHTFGDSTYYLIYENEFKTSLEHNNGHFIYILEDLNLRLYYKKDDILYQVACKETDGEWFLYLENGKISDNNCIIYINKEEELVNQLIDTSWIKYNRENAISRIRAKNSNLSLESQFLIHHEYSDEENNINLIPLKNNLTYQGTVTNGNNLFRSNDNRIVERPLVDFRNYHSINSGYNQELGTENITLSFTFTDQVYHINEGEDCIFTLSDNGSEIVFPALYPYERLNINDSAFVRNGAFASNIPYFADKFYKLENHTTPINNCVYHCTWLYQPDESTYPVWLDRYYYPDKISRKALLEKDCFNLSFRNIIDMFYQTSSLDYTEVEKESIKNMEKELQERGYIDKISDLALESGTTYKYSRISKDMVNEVMNLLADDNITLVKDERTNDINLDNGFAFNNEQWRKISAEKFANTKSINFNTDIFLNPKKKIGIQLFGCDYKHGLNIQNRKDLCPFVYYATAEEVYMLNNNYEVCNKLSIKEKYNEEIKNLVVSAPFDDLYLFTESSLYILDYDLRLKNEITIETILDNGEIPGEYRDILAKNIILHNKNLYAIVNEGNDILKIIFNPENDNDILKLGSKLVSSRILDRGEYLTNLDSQSINISSGETAKIKTILFSNNKLYGFSYDIIKVAHDGDTLYGIIKDKGLSDNNDDDWYYIYYQSLGKLQNTLSASHYAEFTSDISVDSIAFGTNGYFALIRGFNNSDKDKTLEIYDKSKTKIYNYPLQDYSKVISLDFYRYIDSAMKEHDVFVALVSINGLIVAVEYQIDEEKVITHTTILEDKVVNNFNHIIDSNKFITKLDENYLYFNLYLNENKPPLTYIWDITEAQKGWYNINVAVDLDNAIFEVKINDKVISYIDNNTNSEFYKYSHYNNLIFDSSYYLGIVGKQYGTTLNEILNGHSVYDSYSCKNSKVENTSIIRRNISYYEYQALRLKYSKINPLVLTLPCGIRNGIEEIIRYFKFAKPASISSKIKINIAGLDGIKNNKQKELLKSSIKNALKNNDYLIDINEIEFI